MVRRKTRSPDFGRIAGRRPWSGRRCRRRPIPSRLRGGPAPERRPTAGPGWGTGRSESHLSASPGELVDQLARFLVAVLDGRTLHEVRGRSKQRAADAAVLGDLAAAEGVDDHTGRVGRVPHLQLELDVEGHVAEVAALAADVSPLAVVEPRHMVARADVDVVVGDALVDLARDRLRLRDLLGLQTLPLEHVLEVHVAAEVQLVCAVARDTAILEQAGEHAVRDSRAHLALDVVADDRHAGLLELRSPPGGGRGE